MVSVILIFLILEVIRGVNAKQMRAVLLTVEGGFTQKQIAEELKVTEQTLVNWKKNKNTKMSYLMQNEKCLKV